MDVTAKKVSIFPKVVGKDKPTKIFETTIARKDIELGYKDNYTIQVKFAKDVMTDEKAEAFKEGYVYQFELEGFLTTRSYVTKEGVKRIEPLIFVTKAKCLDKGKEVKKPSEKSIDVAEEDALPLK